MILTTMPTPDEINAVIEDIIAADVAQVPDNTRLADLWTGEAFDPQGELEGIGYGWTPAEATAGAWIVACGWLDSVTTRNLRTIPRSVPEGWRFVVYPPGEGPVWESRL